MITNNNKSKFDYIVSKLSPRADKRLKPVGRNAAGGVIGGAGIESQQGTTLFCSRYNSR